MEPKDKCFQVCIALLTIAMVSLIAIPSVAAQTATRTLPDSMAPDETFEVGIEATDYGAMGQAIETLPTGFSYINSSLPTDQVAQDGQNVKFTLMGTTSFTYNVTASAIEDTYALNGTLKDEDKNEYEVGGDQAIAVKSIFITFIPPTPENGTEIMTNYVITVSVESANPISTVWLKWNETESYYMTELAANNYYYNVTNLPNGEYSYVVHANDTANNSGMSETRTVTVKGFDPWNYDTDGNGEIDKGEAVGAVIDYFAGDKTKEQVIKVILLYFG